MSDENQTEDIVEDQLQDEIVDEVNEENLEEKAKAKEDAVPSKADKEVDGQAAADDAGKGADAGVKKAADPKAKKPATKAGMINSMFQKMSGMSKAEVGAMYDNYNESNEETGEVVKANDFDEDLNALVESEATLSDGFRSKAEVIFEAAVSAKVADHVNKLDEQYKEEISEETQRIHSEVVDKVDGYLNYVVEKWMEENKIAMESGLRNEISESFIKALHGVFNEHYIDVPDAKIDLVDELAKKNDDLEDQLNTAVGDNIKLKESNAELNKDAIIRESASDLSEAQTEKLKSLAEKVTYDSSDDYRQKINTLKESYFKKAPAEKSTEAVQVEDDADTNTVEVSESMQSYLAALKRAK